MKPAKTSREAWEILNNLYKSKGLRRKTTLYKQLYRMRKESSISMMQQLVNRENKIDQPQEVGVIYSR